MIGKVVRIHPYPQNRVQRNCTHKIMKTFFAIFAAVMTLLLLVMSFQIVSENPTFNANWIGGLILWGFYFAVFFAMFRKK